MIKLFEAFAGYGSQRMALRNIGVPFESVGVSEIEGDVIRSYAAIHTDFLNQREDIDAHVTESREKMVEYLESINVPLDYKTFKNRARILKDAALKEMYLANKLIGNFGDISRIDPSSLPDMNLFTYSFPCQDISVAGYQRGLNANSGTRSSLLWECCKIIEAKKPRFLMMENVKNLVGCNHKQNFLKFLEYLEGLGYMNSWRLLNARDYGTPQNRVRVFCVSEYQGRHPFVLPDPIPLTSFMKDKLESNVPDSYFLSDDQVAEEPIIQDWSYCLDSNYWKGTFLKDFLMKHRRQLVTDGVNSDGLYRVRRLTPRETWRLMGVRDADIDKASRINSNTALYKQSGNSIVVSVLEAIFTQLFINKDKAFSPEASLPLWEAASMQSSSSGTSQG